MAATLSGRCTVYGDDRVYRGALTMASTSTTGTVIIPGIRKIEAVSFTPVSGATAVFSVHVNVASGGTSTNGHLGITSALSSNIFSIVVYGD